MNSGDTGRSLSHIRRKKIVSRSGTPQVTEQPINHQRILITATGTSVSLVRLELNITDAVPKARPHAPDSKISPHAQGLDHSF